MSTSPSPNVLTISMLRKAVEQLQSRGVAPLDNTFHIVVHPIDTRMHVYCAGWLWAAKQFYRTWNNRTDYERMDGLAWLVRGLFDQV